MNGWREWRLATLAMAYGMAFEALWLGQPGRALALLAWGLGVVLVGEVARYVRRHLRWTRGVA